MCPALYAPYREMERDHDEFRRGGRHKELAPFPPPLHLGERRL